jgi:hypothetical protein
MPIIEQAIREEKKMSDDKNEKRCHLFSLVVSDDDVACRTFYPMYDFLCFLYTIIQLYASINCQSIEIDRYISTKRKKMINEDALIYIYTRLMSMYLVQI